MNDTTPDPLDEILAEYLAAVDAGATPDRAAILARHPEPRRRLAAILRQPGPHGGPRRAPAARADRDGDGGDSRGRCVHIRWPDQRRRFPDPGRSARWRRAGAAATRSATSAITSCWTSWAGAGMGVVFKARQVSLNRLVALKIIRSADLASEDELRRFQNEAEAVAQLDHPQIVPIIEVGECGRRKYFSMKLIVGARPRRREGPLPRRSPRGGAPRLGGGEGRASRAPAGHPPPRPEALEHPHRRRPASPTSPTSGWRRRSRPTAAITRSGAIMGTPAYMAPEQASGKRGLVTTASDVYGLGAVLYDLLTGRPPFRGDSVIDTLKLVVEQEPDPDPAAECQGRSRPGDDLPEMPGEGPRSGATPRPTRWPTTSIAGSPASRSPRVPTSMPERVWKWARRHPAVSALAASLALALVVGLVGITILYLRAEKRPQAGRRPGRGRGDGEERGRIVEGPRLKARWRGRRGAPGPGRVQPLRQPDQARPSILGDAATSSRPSASSMPAPSRCGTGNGATSSGSATPNCSPCPATALQRKFTPSLAFSDDGRRMAALANPGDMQRRAGGRLGSRDEEADRRDSQPRNHAPAHVHVRRP